MPSFKYRVRYSRKANDGRSTIPCSEIVEGVSAASALGQFHRNMQLKAQVTENRMTTIRPKLGPGDYTVESLHQIYNSDPTGRISGEMIESKFDLPAGARNPDLKEKLAPNNETVMPFFADCNTGRLAP